jgi:alkylation response protein AidB-like acyl-CoA dehydrogenase
MAVTALSDHRWCKTCRVTVLSADLLARIHSRAAGYDSQNSFLVEDLAELKEAGYLRALVPVELGGLGLTLHQLTREQTRLAAAAPATALAVNMHLVWTGVAKTLLDRGDDSLEFVLTDAAAGEVFAFAISEAGNDLVLFGSTTEAKPQPDGFTFTGTKIFTSLSPAWTRLGMFGLDTESADAPQLVHGFVSRDDPAEVTSGITSLQDWDTLGMRASQSNTTVLDGVLVPADRRCGTRPGCAPASGGRPRPGCRHPRRPRRPMVPRPRRHQVAGDAHREGSRRCGDGDRRRIVVLDCERTRSALPRRDRRLLPSE